MAAKTINPNVKILEDMPDQPTKRHSIPSGHGSDWAEWKARKLHKANGTRTKVLVIERGIPRIVWDSNALEVTQ